MHNCEDILCCANCFQDIYIQDFIKQKGCVANCCFCNSHNVCCITPNKLIDVFMPLISSFHPVLSQSKKAKEKHTNARQIHEILQDKYSIFSELLGSNTLNLLKEITKDAKGKKQYKHIDKKHLDWQHGNSPDSDVMMDSLWQELSNELKAVNRFFPKTMKEDHVSLFVELLQCLELKFPHGELFCRARKCSVRKRYKPREMSSPPVSKAKNGRANPVGISYLYLASKIDTAIAEVRPTVNETVTIGKFITLNDIRVIDLRYISPFMFWNQDDSQKLLRQTLFLRKLGEDLSSPINPKDAELDYLPTQFLCEFIKSNDWDGVVYRSSLGDGFNIALFTSNNVKCTKSECYEIGKHKYTFNKLHI